MNIPEIKYYTSPVYENKWWNFRLTKPPRIEPKEFDFLVAQIRTRKNLFEQHLREMTHILGITWKRKEIETTMLPLAIGSFSRPLTISLSKQNGRPMDVEDAADILTHELIHNALLEHPLYRDVVEKLAKDYSQDPFLMHVHILVHAVHAIIYESSRGTHRKERDIQRCQKNPPYKKAWEIVEKEGSKKILKKYLKIKEEE